MNYQILKKNFEAHRFHTVYFKTKEEAARYLKDTLTGEAIGFGGSMTAKEMKLDEVLGEKNEIFWHWLTPGDETRKKAAAASVYILSANGVAETGELVNIDGTGNRLSASLYGPKKVIYLIGNNKIAPDLTEAVKRARQVACTKNAARFGIKTPCVANPDNGCVDCNSPARICNALLILERPCNGMEVELLFIDEELGF